VTLQTIISQVWFSKRKKKGNAPSFNIETNAMQSYPKNDYITEKFDREENLPLL